MCVCVRLDESFIFASHFGFFSGTTSVCTRRWRRRWAPRSSPQTTPSPPNWVSAFLCGLGCRFEALFLSSLLSLSLLLLPHTALTGALAVFAGACVFRPLGGMMFGYLGDKSALFLLLCDSVCVCVCVRAFACVF